MPERIKEILDRVLEWWKKFTTKQKTLMVSITAVVIVALVILAMVMSKPAMVSLITCEDTVQAGKVQDLLDKETIYFEQTSNGLSFSVKAQDEAKARILLGTNDVPARGYSIDDVTSGGFSVTEADKQKRYQVYLEDKLLNMLETFDSVESATVKLSIPVDNGTMVARKQDTYAAVNLKLAKEMEEEQAAGIAKLLAAAVGNSTTDSILILDTSGNVLFSGGDSSSDMGTASSQLSYQTKVENKVKSEVRDVVLGTDVYSNVSVGLHLDMNFDIEKITDRDVYLHDGQEQPYITQFNNYESDSTGGVSGTPGTDTNDGATYVMEDGSIATQSIIDNETTYDPSVKITETQKAVGTINLDNSSIAVVATNYVVYDEDTLKANGTLNGMTFDEYKAENDKRIATTVDPSFLTMVSKATGISEDNISITAYDVPFFTYSKSTGRTLTDYLQIALAVLIFAMLGYVVFRSTRKEQVAELEPELSVEALLETTREAQEELDDIGFNEKSETRIMIEKFVDENPEAVASLLRNWLNEEWN